MGPVIFITGKFFLPRELFEFLVASMGPVIFITGKRLYMETRAGDYQASMGPVIFITGKIEATPRRNLECIASMGPVIFITGKGTAAKYPVVKDLRQALRAPCPPDPERSPGFRLCDRELLSFQCDRPLRAVPA